MRGSIVSELLNVTAALDNFLLAKSKFYINQSMLYDQVISQVCILVDYSWNAPEYANRANSIKKLYLKVKRNCCWAHHACNDPRYKHYKITKGNQLALVSDLREYLETCGANSVDCLLRALQASVFSG